MFDVDLARRRELSRIRRASGPAQRAVIGRSALGPARPDRLLRSALRLSLSRAGPGRRRASSPCPRPSPARRARPIGMCCCAPGPSRPAASSSPRPRGGEHAEGRKTYGHSLIVAPWGEVLADAGEEVGFITAAIDPAKVAEARGMVPALTPRPRLQPAARRRLARRRGVAQPSSRRSGNSLFSSRPPERV